MAIYLDTARMGRLCLRSRIAVDDYLRFHAEEGSSILFDGFLRDGFTGPNLALRGEYPGLRDWHGIAALKHTLLELAGASNGSDILFVSSSAQLVRIAARALFVRCQNVLTVDVTWPDYRKWLQDESTRSGRRVSEIPIQSAILENNASKDEVLRQITDFYDREKCDGVFLPAITNLGIRLPVSEIIESLRCVRPPEFVVIDGAQDFCHAPGNLRAAGCDLYVTGCHKWMQAYLPIRLGICCRSESLRFIRDLTAGMLSRRQIDDPLLRFIRQLECDDTDPFAETANLLPLFSCVAAAREQRCLTTSLSERFERQLANAEQLRSFSSGTRWRMLLPALPFRSGVVLMENDDPLVRQLGADQLRSCFRELGVILSAYGQGVIRLSMPTRPWTDNDAHLLLRALGNFSRRPLSRGTAGGSSAEVLNVDSPRSSRRTLAGGTPSRNVAASSQNRHRKGMTARKPGLKTVPS